MTVSIIIPVFNAEPYLRQCLDSVVTQSVRDIEVICVDDGSTDGSAAILAEYAAKDPRVRHIRQKNSGPGVARNVGMSDARGKYILFLDADDMLASETILESALAKADVEDCDCLLAGARGLTADGRLGEVLKWCLRTDLVPSSGVFDGKSAGIGLFFIAGPVPWAKLFRREFVIRHKLAFPPLKRSEDFPFVQLALALSSRTTIFSEPLVFRRVAVAGSLESTKDETPCIFAEAEHIFFDELRSRGLEGEFGNAGRARAMLRLSYNLHAMRSFKGLEAVFQCAREERGKLNVSEGDEAFADYAAARLDVDSILACDSAGEWLHKRLANTAAQLRRSSFELRNCRERVEFLSKRIEKAEGAMVQLKKDCMKARSEAAALKKAFAYRVGTVVTWPARKAWGGIRCLRENGLKYTAKHVIGKVLRLLGAKVTW